MSSIRYLGEAGKTSPATRLIAIKPNPRASSQRRGLMSIQIWGSSIQMGSDFSDFAFAGLVGAALTWFSVLNPFWQTRRSSGARVPATRPSAMNLKYLGRPRDNRHFRTSYMIARVWD